MYFKHDNQSFNLFAFSFLNLLICIKIAFPLNLHFLLTSSLLYFSFYKNNPHFKHNNNNPRYHNLKDNTNNSTLFRSCN